MKWFALTLACLLAGTGSSQSFQYNPSDWYLVFDSTLGDIWRISLDDPEGLNTSVNLVPNPGFAAAIPRDYSPVTGEILYVVSNESGYKQLWLTDLQGSFHRQLTTEGQNEWGQFSPDGTKALAIHSSTSIFDQNKSVDEYVLATGAKQELVPSLANVGTADYLPNGDGFVYSIDWTNWLGTTQTLKWKKANGTTVTVGTAKMFGSLRVSPNSARVAFHSNDFANDFEVEEIELATGTVHHGPTYYYAGFYYLPDGSFIYSAGPGQGGLKRFLPETSEIQSVASGWHSPLLALKAGTVQLASLSLLPNRVTGGAGSTGTVGLTAQAPVGGTSVSLASSNPSVASVPSSVTLLAGAMSGDFQLATNPVAMTTTVTISAAQGGVLKTAQLIVRAPILTSVTLNPQIVAGSMASVGRVSLSGVAPVGGITVALYKNSAVATIPTSVTVPAGATTATFGVQTTPVNGPVQVQIIANRGGVQRAAILFVYPTTLASLGLSPTAVRGGNISTGTVNLTMPAPAGGANVVLQSANPAVAAVPSFATVPAGQNSKNFTIATFSVVSSTNVQIRASRNGILKTRVLTVNP